MARRRMFSVEIISSDQFLELSPTTQSLYFHLGMHADDEGFVAAPKSIALLCSSEKKDLEALEKAGYVIRFDSGVLVITHWLLNNTLRKDRSTPTIYRREKAQVVLIDGKYVLKTNMTTNMTTNMATETSSFFSPDPATQNRLDYNRIDNIIVDYINPIQSTAAKNFPPVEDGGSATVYDNYFLRSMCEIYSAKTLDLSPKQQVLRFNIHLTSVWR